jgi:hypothetical protein
MEGTLEDGMAIEKEDGNLCADKFYNRIWRK